MFISIDTEGHLTIPTPIHDKSTKKTRNKRKLPEYDKGHR